MFCKIQVIFRFCCIDGLGKQFALVTSRVS